MQSSFYHPATSSVSSFTPLGDTPTHTSNPPFFFSLKIFLHVSRKNLSFPSLLFPLSAPPRLSAALFSPKKVAPEKIWSTGACLRCVCLFACTLSSTRRRLFQRFEGVTRSCTTPVREFFSLSPPRHSLSPSVLPMGTLLGPVDPSRWSYALSV